MSSLEPLHFSQSILTPLPKSLFESSYKPQQLGNLLHIHREDRPFPDVSGAEVALFSVVETDNFSACKFRKQLYSLFAGNWHKKIVDLGVIIASDNEQDTQYAVRELCVELLKENIIPILVGGDQSLLFGMYRSFAQMEQMIRLVSVDAKFDLGDDTEIISEESYMHRIISDDPTHLQNFVNMGYQSYYIAQEELDLMQDMYFDAYRLGVFTSDITEAEPILRNADLVNIDMSCVQAKDADIPNGYPNGFSNREICSIARYIGMSKTQCVGIFNLPSSHLGEALTAQVVWYLLEGIHFRMVEFPTEKDANFVKFIVPIEEYSIEFFKSLLTERWWIRPYHKEGEQITAASMIPCSQKQYEEALEGSVPEQWWKAYRS